jgi:hypothetical protein
MMKWENDYKKQSREEDLSLAIRRYVHTWKREFKLPWHKAGLQRHLDDMVDSGQ